MRKLKKIIHVIEMKYISILYVKVSEDMRRGLYLESAWNERRQQYVRI
jgi:hypothetical protein